jgi:glycerol-3-phosphate dehydrogenase (NAD(P)+)
MGRGETLAQAQAATRQTAEGVKSCRSVLDLARRAEVDMPITEAVEQVCYAGMTPHDMLRSLMGRDVTSEQMG